MTFRRQGYVDGLHGNVRRYLFRTKKAKRHYDRGYSKGLYFLYLRGLIKVCDEFEEK